jgi:cell division septation protein DedD
VADANGIASIELDNKNIAVKAIETENKVEKKNPAHQNHYSTGNFEVVLGCFSIQNNANRLIKKMKAEHQIQAFLSAKMHKGMFVVNAGGFDNKEAAINRLSEIKSAVPNAWIKKAE